MSSDLPALSICNLNICYRSGATDLPVVKNVSLTVPRGRTMALVGESGSGKTTIAQAIMGLLPHQARVTGGSILLASANGVLDIATLGPGAPAMRALRGGQVGMVFQEPSAAMSPVHTIGTLLIESVRTHHAVSVAEARERAISILARTGFDKPLEAMDRYPFELSGGLRQRATIASALVCSPTLLIADEPTSALDVTVQALLLRLIADLQDQMRMSVLLITHDLGVVATVADEVTVLYRGEVMEQGSARDLLKSPEHPYLKALLAAGPSLSGPTPERLSELRPAPPAPPDMRTHWTPQHAAEPGAPLLEIRDVSKRFTGRSANSGNTLAVNGVSLTVLQGECLGLVGESGCGKSTLCKMIVGAADPDDGALTFAQPEGLRAVNAFSRMALSRIVQYVFQDPFGSLNPRRTIRDTILEPFEIHGLGDSAQRYAWAQELMAMVGLNPTLLGRYPNAFSGGQRQRIAIARALALRPNLLVCDEPVSALDVSVQAQILNLLKDLKSSLGMTYLFVSHNLAVVRHLADRVAVMCRGRIVELAPSEALFSDPRHPYTKALIASAPTTDPDQKLDLSALRDGHASNPERWEAPFRLLGEAKARYETVSDGHLVAVA